MNRCFSLCMLLFLVGTSGAQPDKEARSAIPGRYTVGLYADERGSSNKIVLEKGATEFDAWIGISGDSTRVFSALVMKLNLPRGLRVDGPLQWKVIHGLKEAGVITDPGVQVEFHIECVQQATAAPAILGRVHFEVERKDFHSGIVEVQAHERWGLSVELCLPDKVWPKPFCEPLHLQVTRKRSFWQRLQDLFG